MTSNDVLASLSEEQLLALLAAKQKGNNKPNVENNFNVIRKGNKLHIEIDLVNVNRRKAHKGKSIMVADSGFIGVAYDNEGNAQVGVDKGKSTAWFIVRYGETSGQSIK